MIDPNDPAFAPTSGLTKREYFAALAMQGLLGDIETINSAVNVATKLQLNSSDMIAELALMYADALIKELSK